MKCIYLYNYMYQLIDLKFYTILRVGIIEENKKKNVWMCINQYVYASMEGCGVLKYLHNYVMAIQLYLYLLQLKTYVIT